MSSAAARSFACEPLAKAILKGARGAPVFPAAEITRALDRLAQLARRWHEVMPLTNREVESIRDRAQRLMLNHTIHSADALQLAVNELRDHRTIVRHLMFPPADSQITAKGLAVIQVGANDRRFKVKTLFH